MKKEIALNKCRQVLIFAGIFGIDRLWQSLICNLNMLEKDGVFINLPFNKKDIIRLYNSLILVEDSTLFFLTAKENTGFIKRTASILFNDVSFKSIQHKDYILAKIPVTQIQLAEAL